MPVKDGIAHVGPEFQEEIAARVSSERNAPGLHHNAATYAGRGIVRQRKGRGGETAQRVGIVKAAGSVIPPLYKYLLNGIVSARLHPSIGFAEVARVFLREHGKQAVRKKPHGALAENGCAYTLAIGC